MPLEEHGILFPEAARESSETINDFTFKGAIVNCSKENGASSSRSKFPIKNSFFFDQVLLIWYYSRVKALQICFQYWDWLFCL